MKQLTERRTIRFTKQQSESLEVLNGFGVDVSRFIRDAIAEKIRREWKGIKEAKTKVKLPF